MSSRTAERAKAVRKAWEREQQLVSSGEGTRDWTPTQQQSILDIGVALDDEGKPFEGQHMKSVAAYPEYAGDPDNIQFLTRQEHLEAHDGNWQNPTNWYYDPATKEKHVFGEGLVPCEKKPLSDPIRPIDTSNVGLNEKEGSIKGSIDHTAPEQSSDGSSFGDKKNNRNNNSAHGTTSQTSAEIKPDSPTVKKTIWERLSDLGNAVKNFSEDHPVLSGILKFTGAAIITYGVGKAASGGSGSSQSSNDNDYSSSSGDSDSVPDDSDVADERNYPDERSSPREHDVSGYDRQQNGKTVHVNPYKRGGKKDE